MTRPHSSEKPLSAAEPDRSSPALSWSLVESWPRAMTLSGSSSRLPPACAMGARPGSNLYANGAYCAVWTDEEQRGQVAEAMHQRHDDVRNLGSPSVLWSEGNWSITPTCVTPWRTVTRARKLLETFGGDCLSIDQKPHFNLAANGDSPWHQFGLKLMLSILVRQAGTQRACSKSLRYNVSQMKGTRYGYHHNGSRPFGRTN